MSWYRVRVLTQTISIYAFIVDGLVHKLHFSADSDEETPLSKDRAVTLFCRRYEFRLKEIRVSGHNRYFDAFLQSYHPKATLGVIDFIFDQEPTMNNLAILNLYPSYTLTTKTLSPSLISKALSLPLLGLHFLRLCTPVVDLAPLLHLLVKLAEVKRGYNPLNNQTNRLIVYLPDKDMTLEMSKRLESLGIFKFELRYLANRHVS